MWSRTEVVKKMSLMLVGMSTRGPVCWLKGSREKDVSSDDHCMFSALWLKRKGRAHATLCPVQFQLLPYVVVYVYSYTHFRPALKQEVPCVDECVLCTDGRISCADGHVPCVDGSVLCTSECVSGMAGCVSSKEGRVP